MDAEPKGITGDLFATPGKPATHGRPQPLPDAPSKRTPPAAPTRPGDAARKLPAYYYRLPLRAQRCYLASDALDRLPLTPGPAAFAMVAALMKAIEAGAPSVVRRASQALLDEVCRLLKVPPVRIAVRSVRPRNSRGELHGLFYPRSPAAATAPLIVLWMRTAQRHDVVKPRTYLRTLLHELGHYLDYALLRLDDSYHTIGFYQRESFLLRTLSPRDDTPTRPR